MKKWGKISWSIALFMLIGYVFYIVSAFVGNPISKIIVKNTVQKYISENYANQNLQVSEISYNFNTGYYTAKIKSPTSKDTHFSVSVYDLRKIIYDSYEDDVLGKYNTYRRINDLYSSKVENIFENKNISYKGDIYFGEINLKEISELKLDKNYDINKLGKKYGHITFYAEDKDVSVKKASEILLDLKNILDKNNISFYAIDLSLQKPYGDKYIEISDFLYSDIYEKGLEERVQKANDELRKDYEE